MPRCSACDGRGRLFVDEGWPDAFCEPCRGTGWLRTRVLKADGMMAPMPAPPPVYPPQDIIALGRYYTRHLQAMTAEGLHSKSDIAAQLAARDQAVDHSARMWVEAQDAISCLRVELAQRDDRIASLERSLAEAAARAYGEKS